jgi:uncharacterized protein
MSKLSAAHIDRIASQGLAELLAGLPAIMIVGPRASGKTTTARRLAKTVVRLDRELEAQPFRDDPDAVLASLSTPVLLDEWQLVPETLASVKRAVDDDSTPGRFLLTGSVRAELLHDAWAATGRVVRLTQWGLSERELQGDITLPSWFDRVAEGNLERIKPPANPPGLADYIAMALRGMYPSVALQESEALRGRWLSAYVDQILGRDAALVNEHRDPVRLRSYLKALASNTAGVVEHKTLFDAAGISRMTALAYDTLLEMLFVTERIPAWHSNRLNRLTRSPKRYLIDTALMGPLLGVDPRAVIRNGDLLGRVIETFVVSQLRTELESSQKPPTLFHLRLDTGRREVDILAEQPNGQIVAIEIKASAAPKPSDAQHLAWLKEKLGKKVLAAIVLHTGPRAYSLGEGIVAMPISTLWGR